MLNVFFEKQQHLIPSPASNLTLDDLIDLITSLGISLQPHQSFYVLSPMSQRIWIVPENVHIIHHHSNLFISSFHRPITIYFGRGDNYSITLTLDDRQPASNVFLELSRFFDVDIRHLLEFSLFNRITSGPWTLLDPCLPIGLQVVTDKLHLCRTAYLFNIKSNSGISKDFLHLVFYDLFNLIINESLEVLEPELIELVSLALVITENPPKSFKHFKVSHFIPPSFSCPAIIKSVITNYKSKLKANIDTYSALMSFILLAQSIKSYGKSKFSVSVNQIPCILMISKDQIQINENFAVSDTTVIDLESVSAVVYDDVSVLIDYETSFVLLTAMGHSKLIGEILVKYCKLLENCKGIVIGKDVESYLGILELKTQNIDSLEQTQNSLESLKEQTLMMVYDDVHFQKRLSLITDDCEQLKIELAEANTALKETRETLNEKNVEIDQLKERIQEWECSYQSLQESACQSTPASNEAKRLIPVGYVKSFAKPYFEKQSSHENSLKEVVKVGKKYDGENRIIGVEDEVIE
ncbi:hypothetical protein P9112_003156 [Eukaryota sp. TZLM1-RC]